MPSFSKTISIAAGLLSLASAAPFHAHSRFHSLKPRNGSGLGNAVVQNNCDYPIWLYSCGGDGGDGVQGQKIASGDSFTEAYRETIGVALKVTKEEGNLTAITHFEYAVIPDQNLLYYDISYVNCADGESASNCPGHEGGHKISSPSVSATRFKPDGNRMLISITGLVPRLSLRTWHLLPHASILCA